RHRVRSLALGGRARVARRFPPREPPPCGGGSSRQSSGRAGDGQPPTGLGPGRILCADRLEHSPAPRLDRVRTPRHGAGDRHRDEEFSGTLDCGVLRPDLGRGHDGSGPRGPPGGRPKLARALRDLDRVRLDDRRRDRPRTPTLGPQRSARPGGRPIRRDRFAPPGTGPCRRDAALVVSVQNRSVRRRQATTIVASTLIGIAAAWYLVGSGQGIGGPYETFLLLIGGLFVPLLGVVIAETFVVRRSRYSPSDFFQAAPRWRWPAFASWFPGTALYFVIVWFGLPIGATLPSFALAAGLHVAFSNVEHGFARSSPLVSR